MRKIYMKTPLEQAIKSLSDSIDTLDQMIKSMQESQATLRSWLTDTKEIGWIDEQNE
jgi:prefoldin subunit 5